MKIIHIINQLDKIGGAELMMCRLANMQQAQNNKLFVITLHGSGALGDQILDKDIMHIKLHFHNSYSALFSIFKVAKIIKQINPDISQSWLYLSDFINSTSNLILKIKPKIIWGVRNTQIPQGLFSFQGALILLNALLSHFLPDKIICCSHSAREFHKKILYNNKIMQVIHNGYDSNSYYFDTQKREEFRSLLNISPDTILIGNLARFDKSKGLNFFLQTAHNLKNNRKLKFIIQGRGVNSSIELKNMIKEYNLENSVFLLEEQKDIGLFFSGIDIFCMSSIMEGFPNVLCEAMLFERPAVSTDVGDAKYIVLKNDYLCKSSSSGELSKAIMNLLNDINRNTPASIIGKKSREKIIKEFSLYNITLKYTNSYLVTLKS